MKTGILSECYMHKYVYVLKVCCILMMHGVLLVREVSFKSCWRPCY